MKVWQAGGDFGAIFPPPPPRPPHLMIPEPDGTQLDDEDQFKCDLCSWARPHQRIPSSDKDSSGQDIGWILTLVIVALASAAVTAIVMLTLPRCWRRIMTNFNCSGGNARNSPRSTSSGEVNRVVESEAVHESVERAKKCSLPPAQNHYTHIERELNRTPALLNMEGSNPSSAYYSELSAGDLTYETVDLHILPQRLLSRSSPIPSQPEYE
ncbi:uncharacterized protein LOC143922633 isoform X2 [Arctopsyche grandis]